MKNINTDKIKLDSLLQKAEELKKTGKIDLSTEEDLSLAIMNLISIEEHLFFTGAKTGNEEYFDLLDKVRGMRKELLGKMIDKHEGETWCVSKHLLSAAMRLIEVGTKLHSDGKRAEAKETFAKAYEVYSMFWALRLKLIDVSGFKKIAAKDLPAQAGKPWTYQDIVERLVDCCDE